MTNVFIESYSWGNSLCCCQRDSSRALANRKRRQSVDFEEKAPKQTTKPLVNNIDNSLFIAPRPLNRHTREDPMVQRLIVSPRSNWLCEIIISARSQSEPNSRRLGRKIKYWRASEWKYLDDGVWPFGRTEQQVSVEVKNVECHDGSFKVLAVCVLVKGWEDPDWMADYLILWRN